jgi:hypothetical protein
MGYIKKNLIPGENIIYMSRLHWIIFFWPAFFCLIGVIGLIIKTFHLSFYFDFRSGLHDINILMFILSSNMFIVLNIWLIFFLRLVQLINLKTSEFGVTNKRVLVKVGFIRRNSIELLLTKVEGI